MPNENNALVAITIAEYRELIKSKHVADCLEAFLMRKTFDDYGIGKSDLEILRMLFVPQKVNGAG